MSDAIWPPRWPPPLSALPEDAVGALGAGACFGAGAGALGSGASQVTSAFGVTWEPAGDAWALGTNGSKSSCAGTVVVTVDGDAGSWAWAAASRAAVFAATFASYSGTGMVFDAVPEWL